MKNKEPIFVIGYPKSGNTWVTRICADLFDSPVVTGRDPVNQADHKGSYAGKYEIYKLHSSHRDRPDFVTDSSYIIYVVRDFRDVLVSGYFFNHSHKEDWVLLETHGTVFHQLCRIYFSHQVRRMIYRWTPHEWTAFQQFLKGAKNFVGNWSEHVRYWTGFSNVAVVRYEDLLDDTYSVMKKTFIQLGIDYSDEDLYQTIKNQAFQKRKKDFQSRADKVNTRFLRRGVSGDWKRFLSEDMIESIREHHGNMMRSMGYDI